MRDRNKLYYGIGFIPLNITITEIKGVKNKKYELWLSILSRCYDEKVQQKHPTYKGCSISEEWYNFQNFAKWMDKNYNPETMKGFHLDKDILIKGNKIYSAETCCFVPNEINSLFTNNKVNRGYLPIGVSKLNKKFRVVINKGKKRIHVGLFINVEEAFQAYKTAKEQYIKEVADKWKDQIDPRVYQAMYDYKVEITD